MADKTPHESTGSRPGAWEQTGPNGARSLEQIDLDIAETSAHIDAATYRLLADIAEFDRREGWALAGARSCAEWLSFRIGLSPGTARDHLRVARKLEDHPLISAAFARGQLSYSKVRATFRVATYENEEEILATARSCTAAQLEKLVRACRKVGRADLDTAQRQHAQRYLRLSHAEDGSLIIEGRLPPEVGAIVERALVSAETFAADAPETNPAQRCADALGILAENALENLGGKERGEPYQVVHEGGFTVKHQAPDDLVFYSPAGQRLPDRWEPPELPADPVAMLKAEHAALGHDSDGETGHINGWGEAIDLDMAIEGLLPREQRQVWT